MNSKLKKRSKEVKQHRAKDKEAKQNEMIE
jgi:hypothetical protein